jgi:hypothetical protein
MAGNPNPSPSTRFTSDRQPAQRGKRGPAKTKVRRLVDEELDNLLEQAHANIKRALRKGDVRASMWLVETVQKKAANRVRPDLLSPLVQAVETFEDIQTVSQQALMLAISGDMTFDQLKAVQDALARHSVLKGVVEIGDLRRELHELEASENNSVDLGKDHLPSWGRLQEMKPANEQPAE